MKLENRCRLKRFWCSWKDQFQLEGSASVVGPTLLGKITQRAEVHIEVGSTYDWSALRVRVHSK